MSEDGRQGINWTEFEKFCRDHPQLVRRLREGIRRETTRDQRRQFTCERPEDVVQFLADNYRATYHVGRCPARHAGALGPRPRPQAQGVGRPLPHPAPLSGRFDGASAASSSTAMN